MKYIILSISIFFLAVTNAPAETKNFNIGISGSQSGVKLDMPVTKVTESSLVISPAGVEVNQPAGVKPPKAEESYKVGIDDVLEISVLEPEKISRVVRVAPDGNIAFPYIGSVMVKDLTVSEIQDKVRDALEGDYFKYPVVLAALQETHSKQYMVYGEVNRPGAYPVDQYSTVLRAISMAGGFTKFGSSSRVKVLRPRENAAGYETLNINIKNVMSGDSDEDLPLKSGDMVVVSEGMF